jgi:hypothetical protein
MFLPALMNLLGHVDPDMTMRYLDVTLTDLQGEFQLARSKPRHLTPQPKTPLAPLQTGLNGVIDALSGAHHVLEMFRRTLPNGATRTSLDRLSNRLTKITSEAKRLRGGLRSGRDWPVKRLNRLEHPWRPRTSVNAGRQCRIDRC